MEAARLHIGPDAGVKHGGVAERAIGHVGPHAAVIGGKGVEQAVRMAGVKRHDAAGVPGQFDVRQTLAAAPVIEFLADRLAKGVVMHAQRRTEVLEGQGHQLAQRWRKASIESA